MNEREKTPKGHVSGVLTPKRLNHCLILEMARTSASSRKPPEALYHSPRQYLASCCQLALQVGTSKLLFLPPLGPSSPRVELSRPSPDLAWASSDFVRPTRHSWMDDEVTRRCRFIHEIHAQIQGKMFTPAAIETPAHPIRMRFGCGTVLGTLEFLTCADVGLKIERGRMREVEYPVLRINFDNENLALARELSDWPDVMSTDYSIRDDDAAVLLRIFVG
ncbi:hypothetical protein DFH07DRAFT_783717 [Mycena maculata]|uniref:Uncharacterized protein n=1 Tax=Mycena maculata TaxID=230809 RepID=A0AAD7MLD7_9AGAR|nr:hypothetical protein DFH07DRAFT_783717 [Mycena maculata]